MDIQQSISQLFRERILAVQPGEQLEKENTAFEELFSQGPNFLHCENVKTGEEWNTLRDLANQGMETGDVLPENLKIWKSKGERLAETITIDGPAGDLEIRLIKPEGEIKGALLHTHGGGWIMCKPKHYDYCHAMAAELCGLLVVCPRYRLAPQAPYPAAQDDCEAAARWLIDYASKEHGVDKFLIRGESAGGQLAVATTIRMKHKHGFRYDGMVSEVPACDFTNGLPSRKDGIGVDWEAARQTSDVYIQDAEHKANPDASPLYYSNAELLDLPPALFMCGERDGLRDDALLMFMRWMQADNNGYLLVVNGVGHNLPMTNAPESQLAQQAPIDFFNRCLEGSIK